MKTYRNIIFPVVYGCATWLFTLREERWVRAFENRVLRRIFEPRDEVMGSGENYIRRSFIIRVIKPRRMRCAGHIARMGGRSAYRVLVGRHEGKRPLGRPRRK
jgi:hypothetical protein